MVLTTPYGTRAITMVLTRVGYNQALLDKPVGGRGTSSFFVWLPVHDTCQFCLHSTWAMWTPDRPASNPGRPRRPCRAPRPARRQVRLLAFRVPPARCWSRPGGTRSFTGMQFWEFCTPGVSPPMPAPIRSGPTLL